MALEKVKITTELNPVEYRRNKIAAKLSVWLWGKDIPSEISKLEKFLRKGLKAIGE